MRDLTFAHISDTHFCCQTSSDFVKMLNIKYNTKEKLISVLQNMPKIDFLLLTGDLVHEGTAQDYKSYRDIFDSCLPNVPIFCAMGNHDNAVQFGKGFLNEELADKPYFAVHTFEDIRIMTLDTAYHYGMEGYICAEQMEWLKKQLEKPFGRGTIIITHHPLVWDIKNAQARWEGDLKAVIRESDVIGFFNGHTHMNTSGWFENRPHITGEAMAFGTEISDGKIIYTEKMGWNFCRMTGTVITHTLKFVSPNYTILKTKSM